MSKVDLYFFILFNIFIVIPALLCLYVGLLDIACYNFNIDLNKIIKDKFGLNKYENK